MAEETTGNISSCLKEEAWLRQLHHPSALVNAAKMMGLEPAPTGLAADEWEAICPGTTHLIKIWATQARWRCSCCRCEGSAIDLEAIWRTKKVRAA